MHQWRCTPDDEIIQQSRLWLRVFFVALGHSYFTLIEETLDYQT